jgi:hypothetical protein
MHKLVAFVIAVALLIPVSAAAQKSELLGSDALGKILPASVFIDGENVPTQKRNAAVLKFADGKYLVASLVDTSGYSSQYQEKYIGTLITQIPVMLESLELKPGQYGFGRVKSGEGETFAIYDVGGNKVGEVTATRDEKIKPVRPLQIMAEGDAARLVLGPFAVKVARK